ncbi:hypothetical protein IVB34_47645 [Bradyrhizobium sp. 2]|uniref:hypothetical protein n=1 Tax=unclassified Bradyrhizobium TaxID=2631580 RepID=UPI001FFBD743|nr:MULTISPECIES: hypothetical protein [unclassified Bradyrhizobium]MCK1465764.1 hypothetical protein [Bradyrhizobium sp. 2]MCK1520215.1 hypothetical protein [Bradyrhizobium sp. 17]
MFKWLAMALDQMAMARGDWHPDRRQGVNEQRIDAIESAECKRLRTLEEAGWQKVGKRMVPPKYNEHGKRILIPRI